MKKFCFYSLAILFFLLSFSKMLNAEDTIGNADVLKTDYGWDLFFKMEEIENGFSHCKKKVTLVIFEKKASVFWKEYILSPHHELNKMILSWNEYSTGNGEIIDFTFDKDRFSFKIKKSIILYPGGKSFFYFINIAGSIKRESSLDNENDGYSEIKEQTGTLDIQGAGVYLGPTNLKEKTEIEWKLINKILVPYQEID